MGFPLLLKGKVALVTGASRGIGAAIAQTLAAAGATLVLTAQEDRDLVLLSEKFQKDYGTECLIHAGDVSDASSVQSLYKQIFGRFGQLDILVANAGILADGLIGMISAEDMNRVLAVNVAGVLHHIQAASRLMRRKKAGSIIVMSSIIGRFGNKGQMSYAASKAAVLGAMMSAAKELGAEGIRVNAIAPGVIDTDMTKNLGENARKHLLDNVALGRIGTPEDVADVALFLASDLSRYVSGQVIGVDGGMVV